MSNYDTIKVLPILEAIRKRPGMYIGETNHPTHLFFEILDNSLDEAQAGHANFIQINIGNDFFSVRDNGRGMPQSWNEEYKTYDPVVACTVAHSGGKFDKEAYNLSIGLHGVGMTAVNALSDKMLIETWRKDSKFSVDMIYGVPENIKIDKTNPLRDSGTTIEVWPSGKHFKSVLLEKDIILARIRLAKTFIKNLKINLNSEEVLGYSDAELCPKVDTKIFDLSKTLDNGESFKIKFGYSESDIRKDINRGSVNLLEVNNGAHINVSERAIKEAWKEIVDPTTLAYLSEDDYLCGVSSFILVNLLNPSYSSQTKEKLSGSIKDYDYLIKEIKSLIVKELKSKENTKLVENLITKFKLYRQSINKASSTKFIDELIQMGDTGEDVTRGISLESKLLDCSSTNREETELFITEGDSAGGGLISQRDPNIHAILPLRGKTLNVINKDIKQILGNLEIRSLINAMGAGCAQREDVSRIRYGKIVIATDADVDGANIMALLLGALCFLTPSVVRSGRIYIATPPLFGQYDKNKEFIPIWNQEDLDPKKQTLRFKGLGSMDPQELYKSLIDEKHRKIYKIELDDYEKVIKVVGNPEFRKLMFIEEGILCKYEQ